MQEQVEALSETVYPKAVENLRNSLDRLALRKHIEPGFVDVVSTMVLDPTY